MRTRSIDSSADGLLRDGCFGSKATSSRSVRFAASRSPQGVTAWGRNAFRSSPLSTG